MRAWTSNWDSASVTILTGIQLSEVKWEIHFNRRIYGSKYFAVDVGGLKVNGLWLVEMGNFRSSATLWKICRALKMLKSSRSNVSHFECCVQAWAFHFIPYKVRLELVLEVAYMAQESSGILIILNALQVFFLLRCRRLCEDLIDNLKILHGVGLVATSDTFGTSS